MNKYYDKYLCRAAPREFCKVYTDTFGRKYVYLDGNKHFIWELDNYRGIEVYNLTPAEQFEQGQMDCIKLGFKFYGWVFAGIFALATALFIGFSLK